MSWTELGEAIAPQVIEAELGPETVIGSFMKLSLHIVAGWEKPAVMDEIGLIREREFRAIGAGRNLARDIDELDTTPGSYCQLIAWDPENREIVSMYRFAETARIIDTFGLEGLRTASIFTFSDRFRREFLSRSIELGRSVVNRGAKRAVAGLFAVWSGLGVLVCEYPDIDYFFGNVTLSGSISGPSRAALLSFLDRFYSSPELREMVRARPGLEYGDRRCDLSFSSDISEGRTQLLRFFAARNEALPPIILSYMGAAESFSIFDTARDADFGDAWEIAIAVPFSEINAKTRGRFIDGYLRIAGGYFDGSGTIQ